MQQQSLQSSRLGRIAPRRPERLQVRLSTEEQQRLAERARAAGFDSVSQYVRRQALGDVHQQ